MNTIIKERIQESIDVKQKILHDDNIIQQIQHAADIIKQSILNGGKVLFCGNGGSASDALHLTGELVGRFQRERNALPAICLNADVTTMTSIANDYGYDYVFERQVDGIMKDKDVLVGISTSGISENVYHAITKVNEKGGQSIALLGKTGGKIKDVASVSIVVPSNSTARIQESHIMIGHIICELVENE